jgi:hypothetical protein
VNATATALARCCRDDCQQPAGRNGQGCHEHFTTLVPGFLARAYFARHDTFTQQWLTAQVRHAIREEPFSD